MPNFIIRTVQPSGARFVLLAENHQEVLRGTLRLEHARASDDAQRVRALAQRGGAFQERTLDGRPFFVVTDGDEVLGLSEFYADRSAAQEALARTQSLAGSASVDAGGAALDDYPDEVVQVRLALRGRRGDYVRTRLVELMAALGRAAIRQALEWIATQQPELLRVASAAAPFVDPANLTVVAAAARSPVASDRRAAAYALPSFEPSGERADLLAELLADRDVSVAYRAVQAAAADLTPALEAALSSMARSHADPRVREAARAAI